MQVNVVGVYRNADVSSLDHNLNAFAMLLRRKFHQRVFILGQKFTDAYQARFLVGVRHAPILFVAQSLDRIETRSFDRR